MGQDVTTEMLLGADRAELAQIIRTCAEAEDTTALTATANALRQQYYGRSVYFRGLIEFSSYCRNNCYYCGIRAGNGRAVRYRLSREEILQCCATGHRLGFRTFVLQSGEDPAFTDDRVADIVAAIKSRYPDSAVTLSLGEKSYKAYKTWFDAGADRYLLRHETADADHYARLHPAEMSLVNRKRCLYDLKEIGYQVGAGFMVGSPYQTYENLASDFMFLRELAPQMIGIGPFIPHHDTPFAHEKSPPMKLTLVLLSLLRIMLPRVLLPATTALGTVDPFGREKGLRAGANVVMPNLSPKEDCRAYSLYDNKICTGEEAAECVGCMSARIIWAGFQPDFSRGDCCDVSR